MKNNKDKHQFLARNLEEDISIDIGGKDIVGRKVVKLLCFKKDSNLRFEDLVSSLCKKASQKFHALARISIYVYIDIQLLPHFMFHSKTLIIA